MWACLRLLVLSGCIWCGLVSMCGSKPITPAKPSRQIWGNISADNSRYDLQKAVKRSSIVDFEGTYYPLRHFSWGLKSLSTAQIKLPVGAHLKEQRSGAFFWQVDHLVANLDSDSTRVYVMNPGHHHLEVVEVKDTSEKFSWQRWQASRFHSTSQIVWNAPNALIYLDDSSRLQALYHRYDAIAGVHLLGRATAAAEDVIGICQCLAVLRSMDTVVPDGKRFDLSDELDKSSKAFARKYGAGHLYPNDTLSSRLKKGIKEALAIQRIVLSDQSSSSGLWLSNYIDVNAEGTAVDLSVEKASRDEVFNRLIREAQDYFVAREAIDKSFVAYRDAHSLVIGFKDMPDGFDNYYLVEDQGLSYLIRYSGIWGYDTAFDFLRFHQSMRGVDLTGLNTYSPAFISQHVRRYVDSEILATHPVQHIGITVQDTLRDCRLSGIIDGQGTMVWPMICRKIWAKDNVYTYQDSLYHYGAISRSGEALLPPIYHRIREVIPGELKVTLRGEGAFNRVGLYAVAQKQWLLPVAYYDFERIKEVPTCFKVLLVEMSSVVEMPRGAVQFQTVSGVVDLAQNTIVPPVYAEVHFNQSFNIFVCQRQTEQDGQRYGAYNRDGSLAIPFEFEEVRAKWGQNMRFRRNDRYYDAEELLIPAK